MISSSIDGKDIKQQIVIRKFNYTVYFTFYTGEHNMVYAYDMTHRDRQNLRERKNVGETTTIDTI